MVISPRSTAVDLSKGIAILLVVYGHCLRGLTASGMLPTDSFLQITDYVIYTFHMPLFFFVSGLFFKGSFDRDSKRFWQVRLTSIVYPYFLWSVVYCLIQPVMSGSGIVNNNEMNLERLLTILWAPISPFWFLYALFFATVFSVMLISINPLLQFSLALTSFILAMMLTRYASIQDVSYGFLYFSFGILFRRWGVLKIITPRFVTFILLFFMFISTAVASFYLNIPERWPIFSAVLGIFMTIYVSLLIEMYYSKSTFARIMIFLGRFSMGIFVMHILVLGLVRAVWVKLFHFDAIYLLLVVGTVAGVIVPAILTYMFSHWGLGQVLGLSTSATRYGHGSIPPSST
ncbi:acyltransferase family protein [Rhizobium binxianense]